MTGFSKSYVQTQLASADPADHKSSVRVVTEAPLPAYTRVGNVITANANGALPAIGGLTMTAGQSLLLVDGADGEDNGIYTVTQVGTGGTPFILTRRTDADTNEFVNCGMRVPIEEGSFAGREFALITPNPIVLNTTELEFVPAGGGGNGSLTKVNSSELIPEDRSMLFAGNLDVEDGELDLEGSTEDIEHFQNHSITYVPYRSRRVIQKDEVMFFVDEITIDGELTVDGDLEDITPPDPPDPPTVGALGKLVITEQPGDSFTAEAEKLYRIISAPSGEVQITLPEDPSDGDTLAFHIGTGFIELELELEADVDIIADGYAPDQEVELIVGGGDLLFVTYNGVFGHWDVYGSRLNHLGGTVQTVDATPTTAAAYSTFNNNKILSLHVEVLALGNSGSLRGHFIVEVTAIRDGGGSVGISEDLFIKAFKDNPNWDVQFNVSGQSILVDVVGDVGDTVEWRVSGRVKEHG